MFDTMKFFAQAAITDAKGAIADRKGVTALEYGVIAAAIIAVCIVAFQLLGTRLNTLLGKVATGMT